jgi:hypothetical protein
MAASKFNDKLPLDKRRPAFTDVPDEADIRHGPCAMGPIDPNATLTSVHVLLTQDQGDRVVSATGWSGRLHRAKDPEPPFEREWRVITELEEGSEQFVHNKPVRANAMAIVKLDSGETKIEQWSQNVTIIGRSG